MKVNEANLSALERLTEVYLKLDDRRHISEYNYSEIMSSIKKLAAGTVED
jgi:hypothetical protein